MAQNHIRHYVLSSWTLIRWIMRRVFCYDVRETWLDSTNRKRLFALEYIYLFIHLKGKDCVKKCVSRRLIINEIVLNQTEKKYVMNRLIAYIKLAPYRNDIIGFEKTMRFFLHINLFVMWCFGFELTYEHHRTDRSTFWGVFKWTDFFLLKSLIILYF